MQQFCLLCLSK